jgi:hypothetical protein
VEHIVTKRQKNLAYLKRAHQGKVHWLNVVKLSPEHITQLLGPEKVQKRVTRWFALGLSAGKLLELPSGHTAVRALSQLMEEYEYHISHQKQQEKQQRKNTSYGGTGNGAAASMLSHRSYSATDAIKPSIRKVNKQVVFEFFQTPLTCVEYCMDYCEVLLSLCDTLSLVYGKFLDASCHSQRCVDAILKVDKRVKTLVIEKISQDLSAIAPLLLKSEINDLLSHMFIDESSSSMYNMVFMNLATDKDQETHHEVLTESKT